MSSQYKRIKTLIEEIYLLHSDFSTEFSLIKTIEQKNLKKKQIRHVTEVTKINNNSGIFMINDSFYQLIQSYTERLKTIVAKTDLEYDYTDLDFRTRIKEPASIVGKLKFYRVGKQEEGKMAIQKCLNDLLGFRITIHEFEHTSKNFMSICDYLEENYPNMIIARDASKGDYKATHVYFFGESNKYFPWELQIWRKCDSLNNDHSHSLHKQEYTEWAKIYKDSKEYY